MSSFPLRALHPARALLVRIWHKLRNIHLSMPGRKARALAKLSDHLARDIGVDPRDLQDLREPPPEQSLRHPGL